MAERHFRQQHDGNTTKGQATESKAKPTTGMTSVPPPPVYQPPPPPEYPPPPPYSASPLPYSPSPTQQTPRSDDLMGWLLAPKNRLYVVLGIILIIAFIIGIVSSESFQEEYRKQRELQQNVAPPVTQQERETPKFP